MSNGIVTNVNAKLGKNQQLALDTLRAGGRMVVSGFLNASGCDLFDAVGNDVGAISWRSALALEDRGLVRYTSGTPRPGVFFTASEFVLVEGK